MKRKFILFCNKRAAAKAARKPWIVVCVLAETSVRSPWKVRSVWPLNTQILALFMIVTNQDPEQRHERKWCHGVDKSKAVATLFPAPNVGKRLNVWRWYSTCVRRDTTIMQNIAECVQALPPVIHAYLKWMRSTLIQRNARLNEADLRSNYAASESATESASASFLAEILVRSQRKLFIFIIKKKSGSKYPLNI